MAYYEIPNESETILNGVILDNETMSINDGGTANDTVAKHGYINIYSGGTANNTTLTDNGFLYVHSSATANKVKIDSGDLTVYRGGTATEIEWTPCVGSVTVENGAHATFASEYTGVYYGSDGQLIESAPTMDERNLVSGQTLYVMSKGIANSTTINEYGYLHVGAGGTVNSTWVRGYGNLLVSSGGTASDTTLSEYSNMAVFSGGAANNTVVNSGTFKLSGGVADGVTLNVGGNLIVDDGGAADKVKINANGCLTVSGGGSASVTTDWTPGVGRVVVYGGGQVTFAGEYTGVYYGDGNNLISSDPEMMNDIELYANYYELYVMNGGKANYTTVDGGYMAVFSGGAADSANVTSGGKLFVNNGGKAEHATIGKWGEVYVNSGGKAEHTTVNLYGSFTVFGSADDVTVNSSGTVWVLDGGKATNATVSSGTMYVSGATVDKTIVNDRGSLYIDETGKADHTTVGGSMYVSGSAENTTVSGGEVHISSGGTMSETKVTTETDGNWGSAIVSSGGTAVKTTVDPNGVFAIYDGGSADVVTVAAGGWIYITEGATATNITAADGVKLSLTVAPGTYAQGTYNGSAFEMKDGILSGYTARYDDGVLYVVSGGVATDITVKDGATVFVAEDGVLDGITLTGGYLAVYEGGKVTGKMSFDDGANERIWTYNGAIVDFDLTRTAPGDEVLVNNLAAIQGYGQFTLTVDGTEKNGVYCLADGASGFNKTITVVDTDGETLGTIWVGGEAQTFDDVTYQLARAGSILTLTVSGAPDLTGDLTGTFTLTDGMLAKKVNILPDAILHVSSGAVANKTTIHLIGEMYVYSGGVANNTTIQYCGGMLISSGGVASNTTVYGYFAVDNGGKAVDTTIGQDGLGGVVGVVSNTTVLAGGEWSVVAGGVASDTTVKAGGALYVSDGGKLTGKMTFEDGAAVSAPNGAIIDFDLAQTTMGAEEALVNNLSIVKGAPKYTLTVDGTQENGEYKLADGAAGFKKTITVVDISGEELGSLKVGGESVEIGEKKYTLALDDSLLTLTVDNALPPNGPPESDNDTLYINKTTVNEAVTTAYGTYLTAPGDPVYLDQFGSVEEMPPYHNSVDKDDVIDYAKIVLEHGAKLSFHVEATAAATFTVYSLTQDKKNKYTLTKLQTLKLKKNGEIFTADSKKVVSLSVSGPYYVSMKFTDKDKSKTAYYNVSLNGEESKVPSVFYPLGNNTDDWTDMKTAGYGGAVADLGTVSAPGELIKDEWIGFGDKVDYKKFTLESAAELSFELSSSLDKGPLTLTICKLKETVKTSGTTYSQVKVKSVTVKSGKDSAPLNNLRLAAGDYYFKLETSNVKKSTGYGVQITQSDFYLDGDNGWNNALLNKKALHENVKYFYNNVLSTSGNIHLDKDGNDKTNDDYAEFTYKGETYGGFVCFGDETDYAKLSLSGTADVTFSLNATNDATLEIIKVTQSGTKYSQKSLKTAKYKAGSENPATAKVHLEVKANVSYYVSVKATNVKKTTVDPRTYYNVSYEVVPKDACALAMEPSDALAMTDSLSLGQYTDADALASASASALADLDDKSAWQSLLA